MVRVGLAAPPFDGSAAVDRHLVQLSWQQIHEDKSLILSFDPIPGPVHSPDYLIAVNNAVARWSWPHTRMAVVWRNDASATLDWVNRHPAAGGPGDLAFPLIADPDGRIAALYGLVDPDHEPLWGQFLIDSSGIIRQATVSGFPVCGGVDELLRIIQAIGCLTTVGL
jgi:peroxiredoxin 2/4